LYNTVSYHAMLTVFDVTYVSYPFSNAKMTRSRYIIHVVAFLCETGQLYSESLEKKRAQCRSFDDDAPVMQYDALLEKQAGLSSLTYYFKVTRALERQYILLVVHFSCHTPPSPLPTVDRSMGGGLISYWSHRSRRTNSPRSRSRNQAPWQEGTTLPR